MPRRSDEALRASPAGLPTLVAERLGGAGDLIIGFERANVIIDNIDPRIAASDAA